MTLPLVAAAPAAAPAARPARATGADAPDLAAAFEAVLAKSAESSLSAASATAVWTQVVDEPAPPRDDRPRADVTADVLMAPWLMESKVSSGVAPVAADVAEGLAIEVLDADAGSTPASAPSVEVTDPAGGFQAEVTTTTPALASAPDNPRSARQKTGDNALGDTAPPVSAPTSAALAATALPEADEPGSRGAGNDPVEVLEPGRSAASSPPPQATTPASSRKAADDPAKTAARAALTEALAKAPLPDGPAPSSPIENSPAPIATQALTFVAERAPVMTVARATHQATSGAPPSADAAGLLPHLAEPAPAAEPDARHGAERRGAREEHSRSAWPRPAGHDRLVSVPASMVFPGQGSFAAALDHAAPLAGGSPEAAPSVPATVAPQIVRAVHMQVAQGGGEMTLTLRPEHLGTVTLEVKVEQQRVVATLTADAPAVRGWIAAHEQDLRAGLADLGLQLDELVVKDDGRGRDDARERPTPERRRQAEPEDGAEFEVPLQVP